MKRRYFKGLNKAITDKQKRQEEILKKHRRS